MRKIILGIAALGVILAAGIFLSENVSRFDAERPTPKTPALEPLAERLSRATIPVSVPIATVGEALERRTPKRESGLKKNALGERFTQSELSWNLVRSDLQVSGRSGALSVATELSGEARAEGTFQLVRKTVFSAQRRRTCKRLPHRKSDTQGELARLPESLRNKNRYTKGRYPDKAHRKS